MRAMRREGLWGFGALLALCVGGCGGEGDGGGGGSVLILEDEPDMPVSGGPGGPGGVDLGGMMSEMGGMMQEQDIDPVFREWIETRAALGNYDCTCSQGSAWRPIWDQQTCINHWTRLIGGEETLACQHNELTSTESAKARFYPYAQCHIANDRQLLACFGVNECNTSADSIINCIDIWNKQRVFCNQNYHDVNVVIMNSCRAVSDYPIVDALSLSSNMRFSGKMTKSIVHPYGLGDTETEIYGVCGSGSCTSFTIRFENNGTYKSYAYVGSSSSFDEYSDAGVYGVDDNGRLYFSDDCKEKSSFDLSFFFQRAFFNAVSLKSGAGILTDYGRGFLSRDYTVADICEM